MRRKGPGIHCIHMCLIVCKTRHKIFLTSLTNTCLLSTSHVHSVSSSPVLQLRKSGSKDTGPRGIDDAFIFYYKTLQASNALINLSSHRPVDKLIGRGTQLHISNGYWNKAREHMRADESGKKANKLPAPCLLRSTINLLYYILCLSRINKKFKNWCGPAAAAAQEWLAMAAWMQPLVVLMAAKAAWQCPSRPPQFDLLPSS